MSAKRRVPPALMERPVTAGARMAWAAAIIAAILAAAIAADTAGWIVRSYSALPFWDQWDVIADYAKVQAGTYGAADLFRQHGEHRILFPRLIFLADLSAGQGRDILNRAVIATIQLLHVGLLIRLLGPLRRPTLVAAAAAVLALLTFLGQWENLVWGFQVQFVAVYLLATGGYMLLSNAVQAEGRSRSLAFAGCCACLVVAVFSMANGLICAALSVALAAVLRAPRWMIAALAALTALAAALYLNGYTPVAGHSSLTYALTHPADYLAYVVHYIGNIAGQLATGPLLLGLTGLALAAGALAREARGAFSDRTSAVLLAITAFVLASAAVTAAGRLDFGIDQAHTPRYQTPGAVFWAAQVVYWARALGEGRGRATFATALFGLFALLAWSQIRLAPELETRRLLMNAAEDSLLSRARDDAAIGGVSPSPDQAWTRAAILERSGLSIFAQPQAGWLGRPLTAVAALAPSDACLGAFDTLVAPLTNAPANARASGWAWDAASRRPPRRIVMANAHGVVVGFGSGGTARADVAAAVPQVDSPVAGWSGFARLDGSVVTAFAILADGTACVLGARPGVPRS